LKKKVHVDVDVVDVDVLNVAADGDVLDAANADVFG